MYAVIADRDGLLWVGTKTGLNRFDPKTETWTRYLNNPKDSHSLGANWVYAVVEDKDGDIWLGTVEGGLNKFDKKSETFTRYLNDPAKPNSLSNNTIHTIFVDSVGRLWLGRKNGTKAVGLEWFDKKSESFTRYTSDPNNPKSLSSDAVVFVFEDRVGTLWIAHVTGQIDKFDKAKPKFKSYQNEVNNPNSVPPGFVIPLLEDSEGMIWIGTYPSGVTRYDKRTNTFTRLKTDPTNPNSFEADVYTPALYETKDGKIWIGSAGKGGSISILDKATLKATKVYTPDVNKKGGFAAVSQVNQIAEDKQDPNIIWVTATQGPLQKLNRQTNTFTQYRHDPKNKNSLNNESIRWMYQDKEGMLWLATTGGGLDKFDPQTETFTHHQFNLKYPTTISNNSTSFVYEAKDGLFWIATSTGFDKFDHKTGKVIKRYDDLVTAITNSPYAVVDLLVTNLQFVVLPDPAKVAEALDEAALPPIEELTMLYNLAKSGKTRQILKWTTQFEQSQVKYKPFVNKLQELAKQFQDKAIMALLEQYIKSDS